MTDRDPRISSSAARTLRVLKALRGHGLNGLSNSELARALDETPPTIHRCLNTLIAEGLATQLDSGRYAPGVALLQIAQAHADEMARAQHRIDELSRRVSAGAIGRTA